VFALDAILALRALRWLALVSKRRLNIHTDMQGASAARSLFMGSVRAATKDEVARRSKTLVIRILGLIVHSF
jgi:hypothetical protein